MPDNEKTCPTNEQVNSHSNRYGISENSTNPAKNENNELFDSIEEWKEPVSGKELADEIKQMLETYVYLPNGASAAITLWIMHTFALPAFEISPRLFISSPMPGCGKSTLLNMVQMMSYNALTVSSITPASMFRIVEQYKPTLLIDEADTHLKNNDELRGIINAGYEIGGKVTRVETINKCQKVVVFKCFGACAIAGIGGVHKTIQERSINIIMKKKMPEDNIQRIRRHDFTPIASTIKQKCLRFVNDNMETLLKTRPKMPLFLSDRGTDIWEPLFVIAQTISPEWLTAVNNASNDLNKVQSNEDDSSIRLQLLSDIRQIFEEDPKQNAFPSTWLVDKLCAIEESPWKEFGRNGLSVHSLAKQLSFFNIVPHQTRNSNERNRCYIRSDFQDTFLRYLPTEPPKPDSDNNVDSVSENIAALDRFIADIDANWHDGTIKNNETDALF